MLKPSAAHFALSSVCEPEQTNSSKYKQTSKPRERERERERDREKERERAFLQHQNLMTYFSSEVENERHLSLWKFGLVILTLPAEQLAALSRRSPAWRRVGQIRGVPSHCHLNKCFSLCGAKADSSTQALWNNCVRNIAPLSDLLTHFNVHFPENELKWS